MKQVKRKVEIIYTYKTSPQEIKTILVPKNISEVNFLRKALGKNTEHIVKLSCSQIVANAKEKILPFILQRNGKYYFD